MLGSVKMDSKPNIENLLQSLTKNRPVPHKRKQPSNIRLLQQKTIVESIDIEYDQKP